MIVGIIMVATYLVGKIGKGDNDSTNGTKEG